MPNTTHTPGPWDVRHESIDPEWAIVCASGGRIVANVNAETGPDIPPLVSIKMPRDANARLIAAAPDLLALAERVANLNPDVAEIGAGMLASLVDDARAAIAKARGEATQ